MPIKPAQTPIKASTQEFLEIEDIKDDLVILKDGSCCLVLETTAVNFGLLSEAEQDATIFAYAALLNSLSFPLQIIVRSKRMDISSYLALLDKQIGKQPTNTLLREGMRKYRQFIERTIKEKNVLDKQFYLVIPFSSLELGIKATTKKFFQKNKGLPTPLDSLLKHAQINLFPKRDHLIRQLARLGLKTEQLPTQKLIELFYEIYNPLPEGGKLSPSGEKEYTSVFVQPAIEGGKK